VSSILCQIDDKHIPLYRIIWVADVPHFCGADDCLVEGRYEVRIEHEESVWANREERDATLQALEVWGGGPPREDEDQDWD
jgi:hypothetical protein